MPPGDISAPASKVWGRINVGANAWRDDRISKKTFLELWTGINAMSGFGAPGGGALSVKPTP